VADITIRGLDAFEGKLRQMAFSVQRENLQKAAREGALIAVARARALQRHASLARAIKIEKDRESSFARAGVRFGYGKDAFRAYFLEFGTGRYFNAAGAREFGKPGSGVGGPYPIRAKRSRILANRTLSQFFGRAVTHPGIQPQPSFQPAVEQTREAAIQRAGEVLKDLILRASQ